MNPVTACTLHAAVRHNLTAYDAMYVALSETLRLPLLTDDSKFDSTPGHHAEIYHYPG